MRRGWKIGLWIVGVVMGVLLVGSLLGGPIARGYVNRHGDQLIGRKTHVEHVGVNLFTGHVAVRGLTVYEDDGEARFAGWDTLDVRVRLLRLMGRVVDVRHLTLSGLDVTMLQEGDQFNFSSIVDHFASDEEKDTTPSNWVIKFNNLRISHAKIDYQDLGGGKRWQVADLNLKVPGFELGGEYASEAGLNIELEKGGIINAHADYDAASNRYKLRINIEHFDLKNVKEYVADAIAATKVKGEMAATLVAEGRVDELLQSRISGPIEVEGLELMGEHGKRLVGWDKLRVEVANANIDKMLFELSEVVLSSPEVRYEQWEGRNNFSRPTDETDSSTVAEPTESKPITLRVKHLLITDGTVAYIDHTLPEKVNLPLTNLRIESRQEGESLRNKATLSATLPKGGKVSAQWHGQLEQWKQYQDLTLTLSGIDMSLINPWVVSYTGQEIKDGVLGLTSHNSIHSSTLRGENQLDIYKARVGKRRHDIKPEMRLPLKTALYVLKDKDEKILIDLPIEGDIDNPEFHYMKLLWKTLGNLIVKVATSPLRVVGNALGYNGDEMEFMVITPGQEELTSEQYHKLGQLAEVAKRDKRIALGLSLHIADSENGEMRGWCEEMNERVKRYLIEQGVDEKQVSVENGSKAESNEQVGYSIDAKMDIEED